MVQGGFLRFPLLSPSKRSHALDALLPGKHGCKPLVARKQFEQTGSEQLCPHLPPKGFLNV